MKIARIYLRVSTDEQDLTRQTEIEQSTRTAGYYVAGVYREKASGARADRPDHQANRRSDRMQHQPDQAHLGNAPGYR